MQIKDLMDMSGKTALVTGGTGYLGAAMCGALHELGAHVITASRGASKSFIDPELCAQDGFEVIKADLSFEEGVDAFVQKLSARRIDVLINNSHEWSLQPDFMKTNWEVMERTLSSGLVSQLYLTKLIMQKFMIPAKRGSIINVSSMYAHVSPDVSMYRGQGGNAIEYGACKAGLEQATRYMAMVGGPYGIRANSISPGPFPRPGAFDGKEWFKEELEKRTLLNRVGSPDELKGVIAFLASDMSSYVTGADIPVDAGWTTR